MKGTDVIEAIQDLDDWMIEDAKIHLKRAPRWLEWCAVAVCVGCLVLFGGMCLQRLLHSEETDVSSAVAFTSVPEVVPNDNPLGAFLPSIRIGNRVFFWRGLSLSIETQSAADRIEVPGSNLITVLPVGFQETESIQRVHLQEPVGDYDMAADFDVTGVVFENPECPEVIYVRIKTDWIDDLYVRFSTEKLGNRDRISYHGNLYQYLPGSNLLETLPEGYQNVGSLFCVGADQLPMNDLETNHPVGGAALYANDENPDVVYIETVRSWQGGTKVSYEECRILWRRITSGDDSLVLTVPDNYAEHILVDTPFYYDYEAAGHEVDVVMNNTNVVFSLYVEHNAENHMNGMVWFITASPNYSSIPYEYDEFSEDGMLFNYTMLGVDEEYEYMLWHSGHPTMECFDFWSLDEAETYLTYAQDSIEILESFITDNGLEADPKWKQRFMSLTIPEVEERIEYLRKSAVLYGSSSVAVESYYRCATYDTTTEERGSVDFSIEGTFVPDGENYVFSGSIFVIDDGESEGGDLEDSLFHRVSDDYISGTIFYYDEARKQYDAMGVLFWNLNEETLFIKNEDTYIYYPNDNVNDLIDQLDALNMAY